MPHTLARNLVHCVFSTKGRRDLISEPEALWKRLGVIAHAKEHFANHGWRNDQPCTPTDCAFSRHDPVEHNPELEGTHLPMDEGRCSDLRLAGGLRRIQRG